MLILCKHIWGNIFANKTAVFLSILITICFMIMAGRTSLWDRDEPELARAAVEMIQSGNYLYPTFNNEIWAEKPILYFWLTILPIKVLGPTAFACRFWDTIGVGTACFFTYLLGKHLFSTQVGLWAMGILATTLMMLIVGSLSIIDSILLPLQLAAIIIFLKMVGPNRSFWLCLFLGIILGLGMLAKGPIGLLPLPVIALYLWFNRNVLPHLWRLCVQVTVACVIGIIIFAAWAIPADHATQGQFLRAFFGHEVLSRAYKPMEHHGGNFLLYLFYYLPVVVIGFFPWTLHLTGSISAILGGRIGDRNTRVLLLGWIGSIFILMSLAATKLPHYILFIWPAMALGVAATLTAGQKNLLNQRDRLWLRRGGWFFMPVAVGASIGLVISSWLFTVPGLRFPAICCGVILLTTSVIALRQQHVSRWWRSTHVLLVGMIIFQVPLQGAVLPALEDIKVTLPIAKAINEQTSSDTPVVLYDFNEPTLNFYLDRHLERLRKKQDVVAWSREHKPGVLVIPRDELSKIEQRYGSLRLQEIAAKQGINYSKGRSLELTAWARKL